MIIKLNTDNEKVFQSVLGGIEKRMREFLAGNKYGSITVTFRNGEPKTIEYRVTERIEEIDNENIT